MYFIYIKDSNGNLIWWWISIERDEAFIFWYKITDSSYKYHFKPRTWIWNLLDYLFFKIWTEEIKASYLSFWKDRNGYWIIWAKPTLAMTKLSKWLRPYNFEWNTEIQLSENKIETDSVIFENIWKDNQFLKANLYMNKELTDEEIKIKYSALLKSDLEVSIIKY
jgi:hypothetical protein